MAKTRSQYKKNEKSTEGKDAEQELPNTKKKCKKKAENNSVDEVEDQEKHIYDNTNKQADELTTRNSTISTSNVSIILPCDATEFVMSTRAVHGTVKSPPDMSDHPATATTLAGSSDQPEHLPAPQHACRSDQQSVIRLFVKANNTHIVASSHIQATARSMNSSSVSTTSISTTNSVITSPPLIPNPPVRMSVITQSIETLHREGQLIVNPTIDETVNALDSSIEIFEKMQEVLDEKSSAPSFSSEKYEITEGRDHSLTSSGDGETTPPSIVKKQASKSPSTSPDLPTPPYTSLINYR